MRIALTLLSGIGYGGQTYFRNLLPELVATDSENEYHCFVQCGHPLIRACTAPNLVFHEVIRAKASAVERFFFEQCRLPIALRRARIDLLYTAKNLAIFRAPCRQVIAIRNMEPFRYREFDNGWKQRALSQLRWELTKRSIAQAHAVVCVSRAVRDAVVTHLPESAKRIAIIYNGNPVPSATTEIPPPPATPPFLLSASKFVAYANQLTLVEAYAQLIARQPDAPPLWFAGGIHDTRYFRRVQQRVAALRCNERIRFLGLVPQPQLHALMRSTHLFLFPSLVEACPHTLIEAMACGAPIATAYTPPMPEICGDAATYFDPHDPKNIATVIEQLLTDTALRMHHIAHGYTQAQRFTWGKTARQLQAVFASVHQDTTERDGARCARGA
ncbi:glycosyltransferase family 4 protein [Candidatus Uhrbacteria bacterium]|nr:glycosyltransferase family 4 protein [Candidatus Uhrbacteria bacterium]